MSTNALAFAFARQAMADFRTYQFLERTAIGEAEPIPVCHRLLFLQMACEKLSRARLYRQASDLGQVKELHTYTEKQLPIILRETYARQYRHHAAPHLVQRWRDLAAVVQVLAPAAEAGGARPDNCEYPWTTTDGSVVSPIDHPFECARLLRAPGGTTFLKVLEASLEFAVTEYQS
ncbi:MAG: hypothetical protein JW940_38995 [Polyangiaceae bacterium]|nr:hypothetical protein [Polyangiaceae bacterium]